VVRGSLFTARAGQWQGDGGISLSRSKAPLIRSTVGHRAMQDQTPMNTEVYA
jgi:hypothetical protein